MQKFQLQADYQSAGDQPKAIKQLLSGLNKGYPYQTLLGVTGSGKTYTMANIIAKINKPVLVIAPNKTLAAQLYREYKNFFPHNSVNYFVSYYDYYQPEAYMPITDTYIEKEAMINQEIDRLRHQATSALMLRKDVIIVASVSCIYNLGVPENYFQSALGIEVGKKYQRQNLIADLVARQYTRVKGEMERGQFRVAGDQFFVRPADSSFVFVIILKDNIVATIQVRDPLTRKIKEELREILFFPAKHFITADKEMQLAIKNIRLEMKERLKYFKAHEKYLAAERLERRVREDTEMLKTLGYCHGIENYSRHLLGKKAGDPPDTLLGYFPKDFLTIIDESHIAIPQIYGMFGGDQSRKQTLVDYGWRLPSALDNRPLQFKEFTERLGPVICTSATPGKYELKESKQIVEQVIRPTGLVDPLVDIRPVLNVKTNRSQIDDLINEIAKIAAKGERALVNTLTKKMAEDLTDFLNEKKFKVRWMHSDTKTIERTKILSDFRRGKFSVLVGVNLLREGLDLPEVTLVAILDADREGFLRSETSLMQTMGRAARNVTGKVIIYADTITGSLKRALDESTRRRKIQLAYNKKNKITPKSITKKIEDLLTIN